MQLVVVPAAVLQGSREQGRESDKRRLLADVERVQLSKAGPTGPIGGGRLRQHDESAEEENLDDELQREEILKPRKSKKSWQRERNLGRNLSQNGHGGLYMFCVGVIKLSIKPM